MKFFLRSALFSFVFVGLIFINAFVSPASARCGTYFPGQPAGEDCVDTSTGQTFGATAICTQNSQVCCEAANECSAAFGDQDDPFGDAGDGTPIQPPADEPVIKTCGSDAGRTSCPSSQYSMCFESVAAAGVGTLANCDCVEFNSGASNLCLFENEASYAAANPSPSAPEPNPSLPARCESCQQGACSAGNTCLNGICLPTFAQSGENGACFYDGDCADGLECQGGGLDTTLNFCSTNRAGVCVAAEYPEPTYNCANLGGQCASQTMRIESCQNNVFRSDCEGIRTCWVNPDRADGQMQAGTGPGSCAQMVPLDAEEDEDNIEDFNFCLQVPEGNQRDNCLACIDSDEGDVHDTVYTAVGCIRTGGSGLTEDLIRLLMGVSGGVALLSILAGAFLFTVAQDDSSKVKEAKSLITAAVSGLFFIIFSIFILQFLGVSILQIPGLSGTGSGGSSASGGGSGGGGVAQMLTEYAEGDSSCGAVGQETCADPSRDETYGLFFCDSGAVPIVDSAGRRVCSASGVEHRETVVYYRKAGDLSGTYCEWQDGATPGGDVEVFETLQSCQQHLINARG